MPTISTVPCERTYVFRHAGQFLCTQPERKSLFWGPHIEFAIRGRTPRKAAHYARRVAAVTQGDANAFLQAATLCIARLATKPLAITTADSDYKTDSVVVVAAKPSVQFVGLGQEQSATPFLVRALGFPLKDMKATGAPTALQPGRTICRHMTVAPLRPAISA